MRGIILAVEKEHAMTSIAESAPTSHHADEPMVPSEAGSVPLTRTVWKGRETADRVYRVYVAS